MPIISWHVNRVEGQRWVKQLFLWISFESNKRGRLKTAWKKEMREATRERRMKDPFIWFLCNSCSRPTTVIHWLILNKHEMHQGRLFFNNFTQTTIKTNIYVEIMLIKESWELRWQEKMGKPKKHRKWLWITFIWFHYSFRFFIYFHILWYFLPFHFPVISCGCLFWV